MTCPNGYNITIPCEGFTTSIPGNNIVTSDVSALHDGKYDIAWAHKIEVGQPVFITFDFPAPFKVHTYDEATF